MTATFITPVKLHAQIERWPLTEPFRISGYLFEVLEVLVVTLEYAGHEGRAEAAGVYYRKDLPANMIAQVESVRQRVEAGIDRASLQSILPAGGARNALDCALWDLEAKILRKPVWELAGLDAPKPIMTTFGCGVDTPERMAQTARGYTHARAIKIKLAGDALDARRVATVREARPDVWLGVDANQGFSRPFFSDLLPSLLEARVELIEQPFPVGREDLLVGLESPIAVAADESAQGLESIAKLEGKVSVINIKLDKCGGLSEALQMARKARELGIRPMVGNMIGTSLAMAPAFLVAQFCDVVDLDGPLFLKSDRSLHVEYTDGKIVCCDGVWG